MHGAQTIVPQRRLLELLAKLHILGIDSELHLVDHHDHRFGRYRTERVADRVNGGGIRHRRVRRRDAGGHSSPAANGNSNGHTASGAASRTGYTGGTSGSGGNTARSRPPINVLAPTSAPVVRRSRLETFYVDGDICCDMCKRSEKGVKSLEGLWKEIPDRSDSSDEMLKALGFSAMKRRALKNYTMVGEVRLKTQSEIRLVAYYPFNIKKEGTFPLDGSPISYEDSDLGTMTCQVVFVDGKLYQRRDSPRGVMYDVRCVFGRDPAGNIRESVMLFKWTWIEKASNKKFVVNYWLRKVR